MLKKSIILALIAIFSFALQSFAQQKVFIQIKGAENEIKALESISKIFLQKGYSITSSKADADLIANYNIDMGGANACVWSGGLICLNRDSGYAKVILKIVDSKEKEIFNHTSSASAKEKVWVRWIPYVGWIWGLITVDFSAAKKIREQAMKEAIEKATAAFF